MDFGQGALEDVGMNAPVQPGFWQGKRVLLTGHTGFKGSWAAIWLSAMGANIFSVRQTDDKWLVSPTAPAR